MEYCAKKNEGGGITLYTCPEGKSGSIVIPDSVTEIGSKAFNDCKGLTSVTIPDSVTEIGVYGYHVFYGCENIQATYKGKTYDYEHIYDLYHAINDD